MPNVVEYICRLAIAGVHITSAIFAKISKECESHHSRIHSDEVLSAKHAKANDSVQMLFEAPDGNFEHA
jgi:hypothetical protein